MSLNSFRPLGVAVLAGTVACAGTKPQRSLESGQRGTSKVEVTTQENEATNQKGFGNPESCARIIRTALRERLAFEAHLPKDSMPGLSQELFQAQNGVNMIAAMALCDGVDENHPEVASALNEADRAMNKTSGK